MKKSLLITIGAILLSIAVTVTAQEALIGVDDLCGTDALEITTIDSPPVDEQITQLDELLVRLVTAPTEDLPPLVSLGAAQHPPAPGAMIYLETPFGTYYKGIGVSNVESCEPLDPTAPFAIGSNTKMMTAAIIYQLQEEEQLSTDDLVSEYFPDLMALFDGGDVITIDMLLTHTSGLPDYLGNDPTSLASLDTDPESGALSTGFTPEELVLEGARFPMAFEPGAESQWAYSNTGYILLGMIIEQVTGEAYNDVLASRIFEPLAMENTLAVEEFAPDDIGLPTSYLQSPFSYITDDWNYTQAYSAGNVISTPEDMAIFLRALFNGELFSDAATLDAMLTRAAPGYANETDTFYYMHGSQYKDGMLGHGGQTFGFMSDVGYLPELDIVLVTWTNSAESYAGQGVYHVGSILGLTPSFNDVVSDILSGGSESDPAPVAQSLSLDDVLGEEFIFESVYITATEELVDATDLVDQTYSITFNEDGQVTIVADCNTVMGTYTYSEAGEGTIDLGASSLVACPDGSFADTFLELIVDVNFISITQSDNTYMNLITTDVSGMSFVIAD